MLDSNLGRFGHNKFLRIRLRGAEVILKILCVSTEIRSISSDHRIAIVQCNGWSPAGGSRTQGDGLFVSY